MTDEPQSSFSGRSTDEPANDDPTEEQSPHRSRSIPFSRRGALATLFGLTALSGPAAASHRGQHWRTDVDAEGNELLNLGALRMADEGAAISDFDGDNLQIEGGVLTATDTRTNVSDDGSQVVPNTTDINFGSNLDVTDTDRGTVRVDQVDADASILQKGGSIALSDNQSIPDDTLTRVAFDSVIDDDRGEFDPERHEFVCAHDGDYVAHAQIQFFGLDSGDLYRTTLFGAGKFGANAHDEVANTDAADTLIRTQDVRRTFKDLTAGDTIWVQVEHHGGDDVELLSDDHETFLEVRQVA